MKFNELEELVVAWGEDKGILKLENADKQFMKFIEEVFEFKTEMDSVLDWERDWGKVQLENFDKDMKLEMGDILVTLIILSAQLDIDLTECLELAYNKISKRKGKTINGIFVKEEDLNEI